VWFTLALVSVLVMAGAVLAPAARAEDKPAPVVTVLPAVPLGAKQMADIAAKGLSFPLAPVLAPPATPSPNMHTQGPATGLERIAPPVAPLRPRRLPGISEALGPIPRESWIREALRKRPDVAVIGGRIVPVVTTGVPR
jgi:hypothetical protein